MSDDEPVVSGWDLAKSRDWTVGVALDANGRVCRFLRFQRPWPETLTAIVQSIGTTPTLIDSTGVGDPIVDQLQRVADTCVQGFHFSASSKQQIMEGLALAIQQQRVQIPDGPLVLELEAFEYAYMPTGVRYAAAEGMHDDAVCALALAVKHYAWQTQRSPELIICGERDYMDLDGQPDDSFERYVIKHGCWFPGD
ncbi:MAG: hypothetical protein O7D97_10485 [Planctomycetota bacterium]|nr:hypothetical protein [Planctomycetota bacterium]